MRILVIDDERTFDNRKLGVYKEEITYARYGEEGLACLQEAFDVVYLDHDLGENSIDGYGVTMEIEKLAYQGTLLDVGKFVIHSMNPVGRMNMYQCLSKFYNVEFARVEDLM